MSEPKISGVIWEQTLDGIYLCQVVSLRPGLGTLTVRDTRFTGTVLLTKDVTLEYGAIFGASVCDIAEWQELAEAAIDFNPVEDEIRRRLDDDPR